MYQPRHFAQDDPAELAALMRAHPLAAIVSQTDDGLTADHIPLEYDAVNGRLLGHVARANPLWQRGSGPEGAPVLVIFRAEQAYVSPNWYPSKATTHKVVPTWNYAVVHAHGRLSAVDDAPWLRELLQGLTAHHEASQARPWAMQDAPEDYLAQMMRAIVGIQIRVERLSGKFKLSQNRDAAGRQGVVDGLRGSAQTGAVSLAERMQQLSARADR